MRLIQFDSGVRVRFSKKLHNRLRKLAKNSGTHVSVILREAFERHADRMEGKVRNAT